MKVKITTNRLNKFQEGQIVEAEETQKELFNTLNVLLSNGEAVIVGEEPAEAKEEEKKEEAPKTIKEKVEKTIKKITKKK